MIAENISYTQIMYGGNLVIMLLFLINGIFRGAGDASIAMQSLWISNICNIILCPLLIYGLGPIPGLWIKGCGHRYYHRPRHRRVIPVIQVVYPQGTIEFLPCATKTTKGTVAADHQFGSTGAFQFLVSSGSWIFLTRLMSGFHEAAVAGYQVAIRLLIFFLLPAWGMSNAAATLTGQNLGAGKPDRAEKSVWITSGYVTIFMISVSLFFFLFGTPVVNFMNSDPRARYYAIQTLRIVSLSYIFFGVEMVMLNAFNGAGDTRTPTLVYFVGFWIFQIPLAWFLSKHYIKGPNGIFVAIVISQFITALLSYYLFKKGKWKLVKV